MPVRERLAATRKRTLRSAPVRVARSVWSDCQSRVIESRNLAERQGLPVSVRGGSTATHTVSRFLRAAQATCVWAGPGSKIGAEAYWGIQESWESPHVLLFTCRTGTTPGLQRPGTSERLSASGVSEVERAAGEPATEGNRREREYMCGSLSCLIVAFESRETLTGGSL